ncbi:MAG: hypothetical protein ACOH2Q_01650 [Rhodococcus sp. (in: high G+C Gram-positive bacteria)]
MNREKHNRHTVIAAVENVLTEVFLLSGVAAVGVFLTMLASGMTGWSVAVGSAALALFAMAAIAYRAGRHDKRSESGPLAAG